MRLLAGLLVSLVGVQLAFTSSENSSSSQPQTTPRHGDYITEFARLLSSVLRSDPSNVALSPFSISSILSMLLLGTSGSTYQELRNVLLYPNSLNENIVHDSYRRLMQNITQTDPNITVSIANRIFLQTGIDINGEFKQSTQDFYGNTLGNVDFFRNPQAAKNQINNWVKKQTNGKIPKLITIINPQTSMIAVNTVYFKGPWQVPFPEFNTRDRIFNTGTENITVPMMSHVMQVPYLRIPEANAEMIALPYVGGEFAMYIVVPQGPVTARRLFEVENYLTSATLNGLIKNMTNHYMHVSIPRMRINYKIDLAASLKELGVTSLFDVNKADLSRITTSKVFVNKVVHETVIDITEEGTEAASATALGVTRVGSTRVFAMDRPAIFIISHVKTGVPLFWGRVMRPGSL